MRKKFDTITQFKRNEKQLENQDDADIDAFANIDGRSKSSSDDNSGDSEGDNNSDSDIFDNPLI